MLIFAGLPDLPDLTHQRYVRPLFDQVEKAHMEYVLRHMTSYYNRYYGGIHGEMSSQWLYQHIAKVRTLATGLGQSGRN